MKTIPFTKADVESMTIDQKTKELWQYADQGESRGNPRWGTPRVRTEVITSDGVGIDLIPKYGDRATLSDPYILCAIPE